MKAHKPLLVHGPDALMRAGTRSSRSITLFVSTAHRMRARTQPSCPVTFIEAGVSDRIVATISVATR